MLDTTEKSASEVLDNFFEWVDTLSVGKQLDEKVATLTMNWQCGTNPNGQTVWVTQAGDATGFKLGKSKLGFTPSTNFSMVWHVVEYLESQGSDLELKKVHPSSKMGSISKKMWEACFSSGEVFVYGYGDTACEAICRAALKSTEVSRQKNSGYLPKGDSDLPENEAIVVLKDFMIHLFETLEKVINHSEIPDEEPEDASDKLSDIKDELELILQGRSSGDTVISFTEDKVLH